MYKHVDTREVIDPVSGDVRVEAYHVAPDKTVVTYSVFIPYVTAAAQDWPGKRLALFLKTAHELREMLCR